MPARLARSLSAAGHASLHTIELPAGNRASDEHIYLVADAQDRVVVTKDRGFRDSHLLRGTPRRLLLVSTGNITNEALLSLVAANLGAIEEALQEARFVEIGPDRLTVHRSD